METIKIKNDELFNIDQVVFEKMKKNECYIISEEIFNNINNITNIPIKNKNIFWSNLFNFFSYIEFQYTELETSLIRIEYNTLRHKFFNKHVKEYLTILSDCKILSRVPYEDGTFYVFNPDKKEDNKCCQYRIHNVFLDRKNPILVILDSIGPTNRKFEINENLPQSRLNDKRYINTIKLLDIKIKEAIEAELNYGIENNLHHNIILLRINRLFTIRNKRILQKGRNVDRVFHSFSNLSKVSKKFLTIDFNSMDIRNCQPLLLASFLKREELPYDLNYLEVCEEATFYSMFYCLAPKEYKTEEQIKDFVKRSLYRTIFFGFDERSLFNKRFLQLYPKTWSSLKSIFVEYKENNGISLAYYLQNIEAELFNNLFPKKSKFYMTIFDAIYYTNELDTQQLRLEINSFFEKLGVKCKIEEKLINKN